MGADGGRFAAPVGAVPVMARLLDDKMQKNKKIFCWVRGDS